VVEHLGGRVEEFELKGDCCSIGRSIGDLDVRSRTGATILAVRRAANGAFETNPEPTSQLNSGDRIIAIGTPAHITRLEELLRGPVSTDSKRGPEGS